ncbi:MAG: GNAT family N-acetyltransferase [Burkholderiales bacterium]|nr:GNAT family N-acetyltransferase [Burkholderiales bacterium]
MLKIIDADLNDAQQANDVLSLLNSYAKDPMGGGDGLSAYSQTHLIEEIKKRPNIRAVLAYVDAQPAGVAICIEGFSTFACKPLLNIHDLAVHPDFRGRGVGRKIMEHLTALALTQGYCKLTLEVLEGNQKAQALYRASGFATYVLDPAMGGAIMMQKKIG